MQKKRRGGWPARTPEPGERVPMSFRVTPGFKAKLDLAAKLSGRSLAQEIELRLERSFDEERHLTDALELGFGRSVAGLMLAIGYLVKEATPARRSPGEIDWLSDIEAFRSLIESINLLLQAIDPNAHPETWATLRKVIQTGDWANYTELNAAIVAGEIADPGSVLGEEMGPLVPTIRAWLGEAVIARLKERLAPTLEDREIKRE
jgi:hypothetical protein